MQLIEIDGSQFSSLEEFYLHFERAALTADWGRNLDAFNDVLRGGFGTPPEGFVLRWRNHRESQRRLGYAETVRLLEERLARCHPSNRASIAEQLQRAQQRQGPTAYEWLVEVIRSHGPGGEEAADNVHLELA